MIQDIAPYRFDNHYEAHTPDKDSFVLFFDRQDVFAQTDGGSLVFPKYGELSSEPSTCIYLFSISGQKFFLALDRADPALRNFSFMSTQIFRTLGPRHLAFAGITAHQLYKWYSANRYCGRCGQLLIHDDKERMLKCRGCGAVLYPKISPVVIIGVTDGDRLLLIKHAGGRGGNYALVAGFAEVGETIEETVAREVMEEIGLRVTNTRYYKSQPWSYSESLLFGFYTDLDGPQAIHVDQKEVAEAVWFSRADIPVEPQDFSLTNEMIIHFKNGGGVRQLGDD